jgi:hypothetical protein
LRRTQNSKRHIARGYGIPPACITPAQGLELTARAIFYHEQIEQRNIQRAKRADVAGQQRCSDCNAKIYPNFEALSVFERMQSVGANHLPPAAAHKDGTASPKAHACCRACRIAKEALK